MSWAGVLGAARRGRAGRARKGFARRQFRLHEHDESAPLCLSELPPSRRAAHGYWRQRTAGPNDPAALVRPGGQSPERPEQHAVTSVNGAGLSRVLRPPGRLMVAGLRVSFIPGLASLRRLLGPRKRAFAALTQAATDLSRPRPSLGAGSAGTASFFAAGKHLDSPGPPGVRAPASVSRAPDRREGHRRLQAATRTAGSPGPHTREKP